MQITLNVDKIGYKDKASAKRATGAICNRTKSVKSIVSITPEQLINAIESGRTFTPGELSGTLEADWKSQQIIAADIDNDKELLDENGKRVMKNGKVVKIPCNHIIAPGEALEILKANNLNPYFMYHSFSSTKDLPKYRIVFILPEKLTNGAEAKQLTRKLANLFNSATKEPNADTSISNLDRLLFGSAPGSVFYKSGEITDKSKFDGLMDPGEDNKPKSTPTNERAKGAWDKEKEEEQARLTRDIENFDLLDYVLSTQPGAHTHIIGRQTYINPCPICGHNDDFKIKDNKAFWACYSSATTDDTNGSIIDYLMETEHKTLPEALDYFKHAIMHYPRRTNKGSKSKPTDTTPTNAAADPGEAAGDDPEIVDVIPTDIANATKEQLFDVDFITNALDGYSPANQEQIKEVLFDRARELKCVGAAKRFVAKVLNERNNKEIAEKLTGYTEFKHRTLNKALCIGDSYISENGKIYGVRHGKDIDEVYIICPCMVYPLERLCNIESNKERLTIAFFKDGKWIEKTIEKLMIANHSKVVELANYGLPITSVNAKSFVSFMAAMEYLNKDIPRINTVNYFGWFTDPEGHSEFVPYSSKIKFDGAEEYKDLAQSLKPHGDKEKWFDLVKRIRSATNKQFMPQLFMSIALASVLIKPLNMLPFIANIWGLTGRGKTANLKLSTSIWGNPEESKYIMDGDTTATALFVKASTLKHLPLCIDDFSKIDLKKLSIESLIYTLCSGTDRARATNKDVHLQEVHTWKNAILTTFERPLIDDNMKGGAINRVLDFEIPDEDIFEDPGEVFNTIQTNYGFLGSLFVEKVQEIGATGLLEMQRNFEKQIIAAAAELGEKKEAKQILPLSVILTADKIATDIFKDGVYLDVKKLTKHLKSAGEVADGQRAYEHLKNYIDINQRNFINLDRTDIDQNRAFNPGVEVLGYLGTEQTNKFVFLNGLQLDIALENTNYNKKVLLNWLKKGHLIKITPNSFMSTKKIFGSVQKVYAIKIQEEEAEQPKSNWDISWD